MQSDSHLCLYHLIVLLEATGENRCYFQKFREVPVMNIGSTAFVCSRRAVSLTQGTSFKLYSFCCILQQQF